MAFPSEVGSGLRGKGTVRIMDKELKRLKELDSEALAEALYSLSLHNDEASDVVARLTTTPKEKIKKINSKLSGLKRSKRFVDWRHMNNFSRELRGLLQDIESINPDAEDGLTLLVKFFECDEAVINRCDDSNGIIGEIFRWDATELFAKYAASYKDKKKLADVVLDLYCQNDYGLRDEILPKAKDYLPEDELRRLVEQFWNLFESVDKKEKHAEYQQRTYVMGIETIAQQLGDPVLFEKACCALHETIPAASSLEIARIYFENGNCIKALFWLDSVEKSTRFQKDLRENLYFEIYKKLDDREKLTNMAWVIFRRCRHQDSFMVLLDVLDEEQRDTLLNDEIQVIHESKRFISSDALFLIEMGQFEELSRYVIRYEKELVHEHYSYLLTIATNLEENSFFLAAIVIYRALLESIFARAISKYYVYGVRYLKKLDVLSDQIHDWKNIQPHTGYKAQIVDSNKRKTSFWEKYGGLPE